MVVLNYYLEYQAFPHERKFHDTMKVVNCNSMCNLLHMVQPMVDSVVLTLYFMYLVSKI